LASAIEDPAVHLGARHESASTIVHYWPGDEGLAHRISEILDYARDAIGARYGRVPGKVAAYIYNSNEAMADGVRRLLNYREDEAAAVVHVGITQVENATLHMHRRLANWGDGLWHAGVDEYVQGVTASMFGMAPARSATWLDEGLSSYLAYQALKERLPSFEAQFYVSTRKYAFKALVLGRLPRLAGISDRTLWFANITKSRNAWQSEYAKADVSVFYIIDNYGLPLLLDMLGDVRDGLHYTSAITKRLGVSPEGLEADIHRSLFLNGVFDLYWHYTAGVTVLGVVILTMVVRMRRRVRAVSTSKARRTSALGKH
jgi:hypothetical protein